MSSSSVRQCRQCGRLFQSLGTGICPGCVEEMDRCFEKIRDYVYDHPNANVLDISKETGIEEKTILYYLKEGRLSLSHDDGLLVCEECGEPISSGRFCNRCNEKLKSALENVSKNIEPKAKQEDDTQKSGRSMGRMHIQIKDKKS